MKSKLLIILSLTIAVSAHAGSATWNLNPISGDWNTASNWTPNTVPNGPSDLATFGVSNTTGLSPSAATEVNAMSFNSGASAYTTTVPGGIGFTISGAGVTNNSGVMQNLVADANSSGGGSITFTNNATAGVLTTFNVRSPVSAGRAGGTLTFDDMSSAGESIIVTDGPVVINGTQAVTAFHQSATAGNATLIANASHAHTDYVGGIIDFFDTSTAGNSNITIQAPSGPHQYGGFVQFFNTSTAGNAAITVEGAQSGPGGGGVIYFRDGSTAGNATLILESAVGHGIGGSIGFFGGNGGNARLEVFGTGVAGGGTTWGSIEGDGKVEISSAGLAVGGNNLSTTFSGLLYDNTGGPFSKVGSGTLTLAGANTYAGGTTINSGALLVTNPSGSATGSGTVTVADGTLGGSGIITGAVTVASGAAIAPAFGAKKQATLTLQSSLTLQANSTYRYGFKARAAQSRTDLVVADGVTINGATISLKGKTQGTLTPGTVLTVISNTSANPINGAFSNLADSAIVNVNGNNLQADYQGGDGNDLTLTVVP